MTDYLQRLSQHNTPEFFNTYTSKYQPWILVAVCECGYQERDAIKIERFIKKQKSRRLIEQLINPLPQAYLIYLKLSKMRFLSSFSLSFL